ncbi:MAG: NAD(P)-binding domain-containing protein [Candidatus Izimaplasma sp.]|nr:NAD(P)-binding domain-containing protein [Candidatus Izimaplasma bacterium]
MKVFIDTRLIEEDDYLKLKETFPKIEFTDDLKSASEIEIFFGLNSLLKKVNLKEYKSLKWVQLYMAGFDNVDIKSFKDEGILISNARDIFSITIAEDVVSKILYFNRDINSFVKNKENKVWKPIANEYEIYNSTIGIIGTGSIGKEVAKRLQSFSPKSIIGHRRSSKPVKYFDEIYTNDLGLSKIIQKSDYLILAIPLDENTKYLFDYKKLALMKKNALLINIARGQIIVQDALIKILEEKKIRGAALDVTDPEPLPKSSKLWEFDNVFITPHNASSSEYMKKRLYQLTKDNLKRYLDGLQVKYLL